MFVTELGIVTCPDASGAIKQLADTEVVSTVNTRPITPMHINVLHTKRVEADETRRSRAVSVSLEHETCTT